jgi:serine protease Do
VGEFVVAVGHPFGVRGAVSAGVVGSISVTGDGPEAMRELIRADVLLGPGNSGGPLADARGRVVGINAMVAGGLALAVPSHLVERLIAGQSERAAPPESLVA